MNVWRSIIVLALASSLICAFWVGRKTSRPESVELDSRTMSDSVASCREDVARLEAAVVNFQERLRRLEEQRSQSPSFKAAPAAVAEASQPHVSVEELQTRFENDIATALAEPRDEAWAKPTEAIIAEATEAAMPIKGTHRMESLTCLTRMCRLEISNLSPQDKNSFQLDFASRLGSKDFIGLQFRSLGQRNNGSEGTEILVFRKGYPMPGEEGNN